MVVVTNDQKIAKSIKKNIAKQDPNEAFFLVR